MTTSNTRLSLNAHDVVLTLSTGQVTVQFAPKLETAVESPEERTEVAWEGAKQAEQAILAEFATVLGLPAAELKVSDVVAEVERRLRVSPGSTAAEWEDASRYLSERGIQSRNSDNTADVPLVERMRHLLARECDAALEEAALAALCGIHGTTDPERHKAARDIRALKSKPAWEVQAESVWGPLSAAEVERVRQGKPPREKPPLGPRPHQNGCNLDSNHRGGCLAVAAPGANPYTDPPARCGVPPCRKLHGHGGPHDPEPVHDFGWALQRMRAGNRVKRKAWDALCAYLKGGRLLTGDCLDSAKYWYPDPECLLATDWEVAG